MNSERRTRGGGGPSASERSASAAAALSPYCSRRSRALPSSGALSKAQVRVARSPAARASLTSSAAADDSVKLWEAPPPLPPPPPRSPRPPPPPSDASPEWDKCVSARNDFTHNCTSSAISGQLLAPPWDPRAPTPSAALGIGGIGGASPRAWWSVECCHTTCSARRCSAASHTASSRTSTPSPADPRGSCLAIFGRQNTHTQVPYR